MSTQGAQPIANCAWDKVEEALKDAVSVSWDGCHKIYIATDHTAHGQQVSYGYNPILIDDRSLDTLKEWYAASCSLRFVIAVDGEAQFADLIPQFYDWHAQSEETQ